MTNTSRQCRYCAGLSIEALVKLAKEEFEGRVFPQRAWYQHHASIQDLEQSANDGCDLCSLIIEGCKRFDKDSFEWIDAASPNSESTTLYMVAQDFDQSDIKIAMDSLQLLLGDSLESASVLDLLQVQIGPVRYGGEYELDGLYPLILTLCDSKDREEKSVIQGFRIGRLETEPYLGHDTNFSLAQQWLKTCCDTHEACAPLGSSNPLPTRVVYVGTSAIAPRVFCSNGIEAPYAALSHCWGGDIAVKLTTQTLTLFQEKLPDVLPANFRDALTVARRLGMEYLWIDSLCIVQNSEEDWQKEAARMEAVYRRATVVIYAMDASKSTTGFLRKAPEPRALPPPVQIRAFEDLSDSRSIQANIYDPKEETLTSLHIKSPLSKRGWVLQELALAPRRLLYGAEQIYWECLDGCQSARGQARGQSNYFVGLQKYLSSAAEVEETEEVDRIGLLNDYYELATIFSDRKLTKASDKLIAMAGIIQRLHPVIGGQYLAGLWSNDLAVGLRWRAEGKNRCPHVSPYRGPSWSWVSTDEPVVFDYRHEVRQPTKHDMRLVEYDVTLFDQRSPYGQITAASLTIEALTIPLLRSSQAVGLNYYEVLEAGQCSHDEAESGSKEGDPYLNGPVIFTKDDRDRWVLVTMMHARNAMKSMWSEMAEWTLEATSLSSQEYKATILEGGRAGEDDAECEGIILQRSSGGPEDTFERVGYFSIAVSADKLQTFQREVLHLV